MSQANNPLHGLTLETIVTRLQEQYGWEGLAARIRINCFAHEPSVKSSLKFLRRTPWAREAVEELFVLTFANGGSPVNVPISHGRKNSRPAARNTAPTRPASRPAVATDTANRFVWPSAPAADNSDEPH